VIAFIVRERKEKIGIGGVDAGGGEVVSKGKKLVDWHSASQGEGKLPVFYTIGMVGKKKPKNVDRRRSAAFISSRGRKRGGRLEPVDSVVTTAKTKKKTKKDTPPKETPPPRKIKTKENPPHTKTPTPPQNTTPPVPTKNPKHGRNPPPKKKGEINPKIPFSS